MGSKLEQHPIPLVGSYKDQFASCLAFDALEKALVDIDFDTLPRSHVKIDDLDVYDMPKRAEVGERGFKSPDPKNLEVAIIGAGIAGLFTAHILDFLGIPYELLEASDRCGGRILTHYFSDRETAKTKHDYYDIGAMRFPHTPIMSQTFKLFKKAGLEFGTDLVPYYMTSENQPMRYNDITTYYKKDQKPPEDPFHVSVKNHGDVPNASVRGADDILNDAYGWYRAKIKRDPVTGFRYLLRHDKYSLRDYLSFVDATGWFDMAFTENVLESLAFDWADPVEKDGSIASADPTKMAAQLSSDTKTSEDSRPMLGAKEIEWYCVNGGTERLIDQMLKLKLVQRTPQLGRRVVAMGLKDTPDSGKKIALTHVEDRGGNDGIIKEYDSVINTATFGALQKMDLTGLKLPYSYKTAIRCLRYDTSTKVGIMFKKPWWIKKDDTQTEIKGLNGVRGGLGKTDMPLRVCVYPSYNVDDSTEEPAVLLCSYTWGQDSERIAALVTAESPKNEEKLRDLLLHDLARLHSENDDEFKAVLDLITPLYEKHHAYDWSKNEYSSGAFALFAPGHFQQLYGSLVRPACDSRFHIVGEAASAHHAWIVGALESAMRGVWNLLERFRLDDLQAKMTEEFGRSFEIDYERAHLAVALGMSGVRRKGGKVNGTA